MSDVRRILVRCSKFPYPPKDGGTMAMMSMINGFSKAGHDVTVLTMNTPKHYVTLSSLPTEIKQKAEFIAVDVNTSVSLVDALANLIFSRESYHVRRFTSSAFRKELEILLVRQQFDIIQLETLFMAPYLDTIRQLAPNALVFYRSHNVEHEIWKRRASNELNPLKKVVLDTTAMRIEEYERKIIAENPFDAIIPITGRDNGELRKMGNNSPNYVCTAGMDMDSLPEQRSELEWPSLFYLGALDWEPNKEGLRWFLKYVWPKVKKKYAGLTLHIAGRNMAREFYNIGDKQVIIHGEVESAVDFMKDKAIMIVPILSGSGMRIKILEGLAHRKGIVATRIAAEGMGVRSGEHLFIANEPQDFADAISTLIENRSMYDLIAKQGYQLVEKRFSNDAVVGGLLRFYEKELKKKG